MNAIALPRIELPTLDLSAAFRRARAVASKLDYSLPQTAVADAMLQQVMQRVGLAPFVPTAVAEYMAQKQKEARKGVLFLPRRMAIKWRHSTLSGYTQPVPMPILEDAMKLQESLNASGIFGRIGVAYLADTEHEMEPITYDPFLFARVDDQQRHYFAVWDEPGFHF